MAERSDAGFHKACDYGSEFEYDSEAEKARSKRNDLIPKKKHSTDGVASKHELTKEYNKEEGRTHRFHFLSLDAFSRHKKLVNDYLFYYSGSRNLLKRDSSRDKTDLDVIRENHQFLWDEDEEDETKTWEKKLAKKYYDKLFKEYCICDLSRYKENKVALRWRIEKEVIEGKGQFICGNKRCTENQALRTWEVNFGYIEHGEKKNALVKLRLCPDCSYKLNYHSKKKEVKKKKRKIDVQDEAGAKRSKKGDSSNASEVSEGHNANTNTEEVKKRSSSAANEESLWSGPAKITEDKSREEEFDEYFEDMFL